jgi:VWFA-related protein
MDLKSMAPNTLRESVIMLIPFRKISLSSVFALFYLTLLASSFMFCLADEVGVKADLPDNGRMRVINRLGSIKIETWDESHVSIVAVFDGPQRTVSPVRIQRGADQLLVTLNTPVVRGQNPPRIDLILRIPARAKVSVITSDGEVAISDFPQQLNVLTRSGRIWANVSNQSDADIRAVSLKGKATTSVPEVTVGVKLPGDSLVNKAAEVFHVRLNGGHKSVELRSTSGEISLTTNIANSGSRAQAVVPGPSRKDSPSAREIKAARPPVLDPDIAATKPSGIPAPPKPEQDIDEGDIVRVDTQLVTINASVVERNTNRGVANLNAHDFKVFENGKPQEIVSFDSANEPFNLVLLIDLSGSTKEVVRLIREAALRFINATRPRDQIAVITFANTPVIVSQLTEDRELLRQRINSIEEPKGSTKVYDALKFALDEVVKEASGRRRNAIVLMSDGLDSTLPNVEGEGSTITYKALLDDVSEFDGVLYTIWLDTEYDALSDLDVQPETVDLAHDRLKELADAGSGVFYEVEKLQDLAGAYEQVVADLGTVYSIGYRPNDNVRNGKWRAIRLDVLKQNAVARGKRGYYAN